MNTDKKAYSEKLEAELHVFDKIEDVHALPQIFHYWAHKYLRPKFLAMGIRGIYEFFFDVMRDACCSAEGSVRFISLGSGHSEIEHEITKMLLEAGCSNFVLECLDVNENMLEKGRYLAEQSGLIDYMLFRAEDVQSWSPDEESYAVIMANQSLHHFVELEELFKKVKQAIGLAGRFAVSDVIGRNGHMRWPEAMNEIEKIWENMPDRYKYNHLLKRFEPMYENWDCSSEGFEGIRAQDILPLLRQYFSFEMFLGYGNLIDIFVDRAFGPNFDAASDEDCGFIDYVAELDDRLIEEGCIKPTHMMAILQNGIVERPRYYKHMTPEFCTRDPRH